MNIVESIILGLLQGVAEFLPISSSGHLFLSKRWFGLEEVPIIFDLALHLATLGAVIVVFRSTIVRLFLVLWRWITRRSLAEDRDDHYYILILLIATAVTAVMGLKIKNIPLTSTMVYIGFLYTSCLLIVSSWLMHHRSQKEAFTLVDRGWIGRIVSGLIMGIFQGLAVLPGISRSGSTISSALFCGLKRERAGEISFLLSIPAIVGGFILTLYEGQGEDLLAQVDMIPLLLSLMVALVSGYLALTFLIRLIKEMKLYYFAFYLIPLAMLGLSGLLP